MSAMDSTGAERRAHKRYRANFPINIEVGARKNRVGMTRDASPHGLLFNTPSRFAPDDELELTFYMPTTVSDLVRLRGVVVRVEDAPDALPWRYLTAVKFVEPAPALEEPLRVLERGWPS
jgi:hypothetical protein